MTRPDGGETSRLCHGTCVALAGRGVLIRGPSGSGKSDLALRLIDAPGCGAGSSALTARLVADDQVQLTRVGDALMARAPDRLRNLIEIRGLGIVTVSSEPEVQLAMVVDLMDGKAIERLPEAVQEAALLGVRLPLLRLDAFSASAPARLRAGMAGAGAGPQAGAP